jgi:formylglycine-generating enzyme
LWVRSVIDPVGRVRGIARLTRGGSHSTGLPFLRSANRSAAFPEARTYLIDFRVVVGAKLETPPLPEPPPPKWGRDVDQRRDTPAATPASQPIFLEPRTYTRVPPDANGPVFIADF